MRAHIDVRLIDGDLLTTAVDLACFKHAQSFYGADLAAVDRLTKHAGLSEALFAVPSGDVRVVTTNGALAAPRAAFLGTVRLGDLRYHELRLLAARMLLVAQAEGARTLATTVHGVQAGLDESEGLPFLRSTIAPSSSPKSAHWPTLTLVTTTSASPAVMT